MALAHLSATAVVFRDGRAALRSAAFAARRAGFAAIGLGDGRLPTAARSAILATSCSGFLDKVRNGGSGILRPHADGKQQGDEKSLEFHLVLENSLSLVRDEFTATGADDGVNANRG